MLFPVAMSTRSFRLALLAAALLPVTATTLGRASIDQLIEKSTSVVRVKVLDSRGGLVNRMIYTLYRVQVENRWKGTGNPVIEVAMPGGAWNGLQWNVPGTPRLDQGAEYVIFVWTSPNAVNYSVGLAQGVLRVTTDANGQTILVRGRTDAQMVDANGQPVQDYGFKITLTDLLAKLGVKQ